MDRSPSVYYTHTSLELPGRGRGGGERGRGGREGGRRGERMMEELP